jgi:hypothetical protein
MKKGELELYNVERRRPRKGAKLRRPREIYPPPPLGINKYAAVHKTSTIKTFLYKTTTQTIHKPYTKYAQNMHKISILKRAQNFANFAFSLSTFATFAGLQIVVILLNLSKPKLTLSNLQNLPK